jgi:uncharacterized protein YbjT (DUF2867 family)
MRVHVTGGSGFLGSRVVPKLVAAGHEVTALARSPASAERLSALGAAPIPGDLDDPGSIKAAFASSDAEALVNVASLGFGHAPAVVKAAEETSLRRAVFVSTTAIFTRLSAQSRAVRAAAEEAIRASSLEWTILRPTMIYGDAGDRNLARLLRLARRSPVVFLPGGGRRLQQPVHVDDVASAVTSALESPLAAGRAYNLAGPEPLSLQRLVSDVGCAVGRRPLLVGIPLRPTIAACRLYERFSQHPRLRAEQLERLSEDKIFDIGDARRDLAFAPRPFSAGIAEEAARVS